MAFDPDAEMAGFAASSKPSFDPDAEMANFATEPAAPEKEDKPSLLEAVARGAGQGATLGLKDEITAGLESLLTTKTYRQSLEESRANDEKARKAHPWGFGISEALGSLAVPGIGEVAEGAGLASQAARGAAVGAISGAGHSEADDVAGVAKDAAKGGLLGAGIGAIVGSGVNAATQGAEARVAERAADAGKDAAGGFKKALDMGILFHSPVAYVAKKGGEKLAAGADEILAKLGAAARNGEPVSKYIQQAIEAGIPRAAVASAVAQASE